MSVYSPVSDWTSKNDLCIPAWLEKNTGADRGSYLVCGKKFIPHVCLYTVPNRIFHPKTTSDSPLSSKKEIGRSGHISRLWVPNPFWTYVCIQSSQWLNIQKRPLYPSLTQKKYRDWFGFTSRFGAKNSFLTYVYMHFKTEFFPTKQPLIPRLPRKNKGADPGSYPVGGKIHSSHMSICTSKQNFSPQNNLWFPA